MDKLQRLTNDIKQQKEDYQKRFEIYKQEVIEVLQNADAEKLIELSEKYNCYGKMFENAREIVSLNAQIRVCEYLGE